MRRNKIFLLGISIAFITLSLTLIMMFFASKQRSPGGGITISSRAKKLAVIDLYGTIYSSSNITRQLKFYQNHSSVKAVVIRINSPGGVIGASQEIYNAVKRVRESGKTVIVSMGNVAASGAYYAACGADTIIANPGTTTGSIGVIAEIINVQELLKKIGISFQTVKSGRFKDTGSPYRKLSYADKQYLQSWIDDAYDQFVDVVSKERNISKEKVLKIADGRVFTGRQALQNGLVDILGDYHDAIKLASELGGIEGEPDIIRRRNQRVSLFDLFFQKIEGLLKSLEGINIKY